MAVYKEEKTNTWRVIYRYTDWNGERRQTGDMRELLFPVDRLIAAVSQYMTLRMGDLLFTGTPAGAGPVQAGDNLRATLEEYGMLDFDIR